ncbi:hypothetical protein CCAX7_25980 [Capsulimonas corticalis]|uniref:Uncharacterized protein n=1 Tax=Capsulimonas corticalis TaxID=2219043 RepID=A0A402CVX6_9BACT|nr:GIY-YIG nuclease family protein [Capsulimonas corticalis]BDI30547.1 hypothetical protein CCAX7_25980 [Capsulimonas corticalis]
MAYCYALKCADDCYYVGFTRDLEMRMFTHFLAPAVKWLLLHPPREILYVIRCSDESTERHETLLLMEQHGWQHVRGYRWVRQTLKKRPRDLARFFADEDPPQYVSDALLNEIKRRIEAWSGEWSPI